MSVCWRLYENWEVSEKVKSNIIFVNYHSFCWEWTTYLGLECANLHSHIAVEKGGKWWISPTIWEGLD